MQAIDTGYVLTCLLDATAQAAHGIIYKFSHLTMFSDFWYIFSLSCLLLVYRNAFILLNNMSCSMLIFFFFLPSV